MTIKCRVCGEEKPEKELKRTNGGKVDTICKVCFAKRQREWYAKNKYRVSIQRKVRHLKRYCQAHGINIEIKLGD